MDDLDRDRARLRLAQRVEGAVTRTITDELWGEAPDEPYRGDPSGPSLVRDLILARRHDPESPDALERLTRHEPKLERAIASTTSVDLAGLLESATLPEGILEKAARMAGPYLRIVEALQTKTLERFSRPWIPELPPIEPAPLLPAEKTELSSVTISVAGGYQPIVGVGEAIDLSWIAAQSESVTDILAAILAARTIAGIAAGLVAELDDAAAAAADLPAAIAALDAAGYPASLVITNRADWLGSAGVAPQSGATYAGLEVVLSPFPETLVVSPAVWAEVALPDRLEVVEPSIAGFEISTPGAFVVEAPAGSVAKVGAAAAATARARAN
jgi:hypothetical protein